MKWLKELFKPLYGTGALLSPFDPRNIPASAVAQAVSVPQKYFTDISYIPVLNQLAIGSCTGHAHSVIVKYFEKQEGFDTKISPRAIYALAKKHDGYAGEGSYPSVVANNSMKLGNGTEATAPNNSTLSHKDYINIPYIENDYLPYKTKGYVWPPTTEQGLKEALINFKLVEISLPVGNWSKLPVKPGQVGLHRIVLYGYEGSRFFFRNSWGEWGDKGNGYFDFKDFEGKIYDVLCYTDVPNQIKEEFKTKWPYKYFSPREVVGLKPELIEKLDLARGIAGTPFVITSGKRSSITNQEIGGVENSAHLFGEAVDLKADSSDKRYKILLGLIGAGFKRYGIYSKHIHVDIDQTKPQNVMWVG